jgi:hypothetical protein
MPCHYRKAAATSPKNIRPVLTPETIIQIHSYTQSHLLWSCVFRVSPCTAGLHSQDPEKHLSIFTGHITPDPAGTPWYILEDGGI